MRYVLEYRRVHPQQGRFFFVGLTQGRGFWSNSTADVPRYWTRRGAEKVLVDLPKSEKRHLKVSLVGVFG